MTNYFFVYYLKRNIPKIIVQKIKEFKKGDFIIVLGHNIHNNIPNIDKWINITNTVNPRKLQLNCNLTVKSKSLIINQKIKF